MKTFVIQAKLNKPYAHWERAFLEHQRVRQAHGIEDVLHGQVEGQLQMVVIMRATNIDVLERLMQEHATEIASTGHDLESTKVTVLV